MGLGTGAGSTASCGLGWPDRMASGWRVLRLGGRDRRVWTCFARSSLVSRRLGGGYFSRSGSRSRSVMSLRSIDFSRLLCTFVAFSIFPCIPPSAPEPTTPRSRAQRPVCPPPTHPTWDLGYHAINHQASSRALRSAGRRYQSAAPPPRPRGRRRRVRVACRGRGSGGRHWRAGRLRGEDRAAVPPPGAGGEEHNSGSTIESHE